MSVEQNISWGTWPAAADSLAARSFQNKRHSCGDVALWQRTLFSEQPNKAAEHAAPQALRWAVAARLRWTTSKEAGRGPIKPTLQMQPELIIHSTSADQILTVTLIPSLLF